MTSDRRSREGRDALFAGALLESDLLADRRWEREELEREREMHLEVHGTDRVPILAKRLHAVDRRGRAFQSPEPDEEKWEDLPEALARLPRSRNQESENKERDG